MKTKIDIHNWDRYKPYTHFSKFSNPYVSTTTVLNVNNIVLQAKQNKISFYGLMTYLVLKSINEIEEFKYVMENDNVYKYDKINTTFSVLNDKKMNFTRTVEYNSNFKKFISDFNKAKEEAETSFDIPYDKEPNKCYITCAPWMRVTAVSNPINYDQKDSVPRVCWGKYFLESNEYMIDVSIQFNHAFQDGYQIGQFYNSLQSYINEFDED